MNLFECTTVVELEEAIAKGADLEQLNPPWEVALGSNNPWYASFTQGPWSRQTPLSLFVARGKHGHVMCLLQHGAKVDGATFNHITHHGWTDAIKLCNPSGHNLDSALYSACINGSCDIVDYFLSISNRNKIPSKNTSEYVCRTNKIDLFDLFIKHQVPLKPCMIKSACDGGSIDILNRLYLHCPNFHSYITTNIQQCYGHNPQSDQWLKDQGFISS